MKKLILLMALSFAGSVAMAKTSEVCSAQVGGSLNGGVSKRGYGLKVKDSTPKGSSGSKNREAI